MRLGEYVIDPALEMEGNANTEQETTSVMVTRGTMRFLDTQPRAKKKNGGSSLVFQTEMKGRKVAIKVVRLDEPYYVYGVSTIFTSIIVTLR